MRSTLPGFLLGALLTAAVAAVKIFVLDGLEARALKQS